MRRFGEPDTSLKAFGRLIADAVHHHFPMQLLMGIAVLVLGFPLRYGRGDIALMAIVIYVGGLATTYLTWRRLVKKGTWWLM